MSVTVGIFRPSVVKNGKRNQGKVWQMRWRCPSTGKRLTKTTGVRDKRAALGIALDFERKLEVDPFGLVKEYGPMLWSVLVKEFLEHSGNTNRADTREAYEISLRHFLRISGDLDIRGINVRILRDFINARCSEKYRKKKLSPATVNKDLRAVRAVLNYAGDQDYIQAVPSFKGLMLRQDLKAPVVLPEDCIDKMLAALDSPGLVLKRRCAGWWKVFLWLIDELGVRRGEAMGLTWGRVDWEKGEVEIVAESSKGRRTRFLPVSGELLGILRAWYKGLGDPPAASSVLPWDGSELRRLYDDWHSIVEKAGVSLDSKVVPKNFRSNCGSKLIESGASTLSVKDFLGHASVTTTESYYANAQATLRPISEARRAAKLAKGEESEKAEAI